MFNTQIYTSTFIYIIIFAVLLLIGIVNLINHWKKSDRNFYLKYSGLWLSGLIYNVVEGALPDPQFQIGEIPQNILAWTVGIAVAFHFLTFLKMEYNIKFQKKDFSLNVIGMIALLLFVILFILPYTITKSIEQSRVFFIAFVLVVLLIGDLFFVKQLFSRFKTEENLLRKIHSVNGMIGLFGLFSLPATILVFGDNQLIEQSLFSFGIFAVTVDYFLYPRRKEQNKNAISFDNLSPRETEILTLILENPDLKYSEMSNQLNISQKTISTHLSNIYKKTNLNNKKDIEQLSKSFRNSVTA